MLENGRVTTFMESNLFSIFITYFIILKKRGTYTWHNGSKYTGDWAFDEHNGIGVYTCPSGESYEGEWQRNMRNGHGKEKWHNGAEYFGEWRENRKHGRGVFRWLDGDFFSGEWIEGKRSRGLLVSEDEVNYQEWKVDDPPTDELDKCVIKNVKLGERIDYESIGKECNWDVDNVLRKKMEMEIPMDRPNKKQRL